MVGGKDLDYPGILASNLWSHLVAWMAINYSRTRAGVGTYRDGHRDGFIFGEGEVYTVFNASSSLIL